MKFKLALFLLVLTVYMLFSSGTPLEGEQQLDVARIVLREGALSTHSTDVTFAAYGLKGINGKFYDCHGITNVLLMLPVAILEWVANHFGIENRKAFSLLGSLSGAVINSLACLVFFQILQEFKRPLKVSLYATLCLAFGTIVFPYASHNYEGNLNMLLILGSLYFAFKYNRKRRMVDLFWCSNLAGLAINSRELSWLFLLSLALYLLSVTLREKQTKALLWFAGFLAPYIAFWGYYNYIRTGSALLPATIKVTDSVVGSAISYDLLTGFSKLLISPGGSIFLYSPVLILGVLGMGRFLKEERKDAWPVLSTILLFFVFLAPMKIWFGSWGWGNRYTLEITPLMALPIAYWLSPERLKNWASKGLLIGLLLYGSLLGIAANATNWSGRLEYLINLKGWEAFYFNPMHSQWWDGLRTLAINTWNLRPGSSHPIANPGYANGMSEVSLAASQSMFSWWNRLLLLGARPGVIVLYLVISFITIVSCLKIVFSYANKQSQC